MRAVAVLRRGAAGDRLLHERQQGMRRLTGHSQERSKIVVPDRHSRNRIAAQMRSERPAGPGRIPRRSVSPSAGAAAFLLPALGQAALMRAFQVGVLGCGRAARQG